MIEVRQLDPTGAELALLPFSRLDQPGGEYLVAWDGNAPVGHAHLDRRPDPPELQDVFVCEPLRRRGIATALSEAAERRARMLGHVQLALEVGSENAAARSLYEKLGYRATGAARRVKGTIVVRGGPIEVDDTLHRMVKSLP